MRPATIRIPQPCAQDWAAMTPTAAGRHCAACQKTVVDFTQKTDAEILALLRRAARASTCGRFRAEQLGRKLQPAETAGTWRVWLSTLLTAGSLGTLPAAKSIAQTGPGSHSPGPAPLTVTSGKTKIGPQTPPAPLEPRHRLPSAEETPAADASRRAESVTLRGIVLDKDTQEALPGVTALLKNTALGVSTNARGEFALTIPRSSQQPVLVFSSVGYMALEAPVLVPQESNQATSIAESMRIILQSDGAMLSGEVVIIAGGAFYRKPWHPRAFWFWLTRPFRR